MTIYIDDRFCGRSGIICRSNPEGKGANFCRGKTERRVKKEGAEAETSKNGISTGREAFARLENLLLRKIRRIETLRSAQRCPGGKGKKHRDRTKVRSRQKKKKEILCRQNLGCRPGKPDNVPTENGHTYRKHRSKCYLRRRFRFGSAGDKCRAFRKTVIRTVKIGQSVDRKPLQPFRKLRVS